MMNLFPSCWFETWFCIFDWIAIRVLLDCKYKDRKVVEREFIKGHYIILKYYFEIEMNISNSIGWTLQ